MDLGPIETALKSIVAAIALAVVGSTPAPPVVQWENEPRVRALSALVLLSWVSSADVGQDETRWTNSGDPAPASNLVPTITGPRRLVLQLAVERHDQRPGYTSRALAEQLRVRLQFASSLAALAAANIALAGVEAATPADYRADGRWVSQTVVEVRLNATAYQSDADGAVPSIETVGVSSALTNPAGDLLADALQLDEEVVP